MVIMSRWPMTTLLVLGLFRVNLALAAEAQTSPSFDKSPRAIHAISKAARSALRSEATAESVAEREAAIRELITVYEQAAHHARFWTSKTLQQRALQIRHRLEHVHKDLVEAALPRPERLEHPQTVLAQRLDNPGFNARGANPVPNAIPFNANAANTNSSQELIELIERTITPTVWQAAGGNASMAYFHPSLALVVTADHETHRRVAALLDGLRQAGP